MRRVIWIIVVAMGLVVFGASCQGRLSTLEPTPTSVQDATRQALQPTQPPTLVPSRTPVPVEPTDTPLPPTERPTEPPTQPPSPTAVPPVAGTPTVSAPDVGATDAAVSTRVAEAIQATVQALPSPTSYPEQPTLTPYPDQPTLTPYAKQPTLTPYPKLPTLTPYPDQPTLTPLADQPTLTPYPDQPTLTPLAEQPTLTPYPEQPTLTPLPDQPSLTPYPDQPTLTPLAEQPTLTPYPDQPTLTPLAEQPTLTPYPDQPTLTPLPDQPTLTPYPEQPTLTPYPEQPTLTPYPDQPTLTPYPDQPTLTLYPTQPPLTPRPTQALPTPYPTQPMPTPYPVQPTLTPYPDQPTLTPYPDQPTLTLYPTQPPLTARPTQALPSPYPTQPMPTPYPVQPTYTLLPTKEPPTVPPTLGATEPLPTEPLPTLPPTERATMTEVPPTVPPTEPPPTIAPSPTGVAVTPIAEVPFQTIRLEELGLAFDYPAGWLPPDLTPPFAAIGNPSADERETVLGFARGRPADLVEAGVLASEDPEEALAGVASGIEATVQRTDRFGLPAWEVVGQDAEVGFHFYLIDLDGEWLYFGGATASARFAEFDATILERVASTLDILPQPVPATPVPPTPTLGPSVTPTLNAFVMTQTQLSQELTLTATLYVTPTIRPSVTPSPTTTRTLTPTFTASPNYGATATLIVEQATAAAQVESNPLFEQVGAVPPAGWLPQSSPDPDVLNVTDGTAHIFVYAWPVEKLQQHWGLPEGDPSVSEAIDSVAAMRGGTVEPFADERAGLMRLDMGTTQGAIYVVRLEDGWLLVSASAPAGDYDAYHAEAFDPFVQAIIETVYGTAEPAAEITAPALTRYEDEALGLAFDAPDGWTPFAYPAANAAERGVASVMFHADEADAGEGMLAPAHPAVLVLRADLALFSPDQYFESAADVLAAFWGIDPAAIEDYATGEYAGARAEVALDTGGQSVNYALALGGTDWLMVTVFAPDDNAAGWDAAVGQPLLDSLQPLPGVAADDADGDGVLDADDACPDEPGTLAGCPNADGDRLADADDACPDEAGPTALDGCPADTDGDGVLNRDDACPYEVGEGADGCPVAGAVGAPGDADGDGVPDADDACPDEPGMLAGCPNADGDRLADADDACPDEAGPTALDGCPADTDGDGVLNRDDACPYEVGEGADGCPVEGASAGGGEPVTLVPYDGIALGLKVEMPAGWFPYVDARYADPDDGMEVLYFFQNAGDSANPDDIPQDPAYVLMRIGSELVGASGLESPEAFLTSFIGQDVGAIDSFEAAFPGVRAVASDAMFPDESAQGIIYVLELGADDWLMGLLVAQPGVNILLIDETIMQPVLRSIRLPIE